MGEGGGEVEMSVVCKIFVHLSVVSIFFRPFVSCQ